MNVHLVLRLLDTFFRRKWLYVLLIAVVGAAGFWSVASSEDSYRSIGTMKVEPDTRVAQLTGSESDPGFGFESPADATAQSIISLLGTGSFVDTVIVKSGLESAVQAGLTTPDELRSSIGVFPDGTRLVKVVGAHRDPAVAQRLSAATMEAYVEAVMVDEISDNVVAREFLEEKVPDYEADVAAAEDALASWLSQNPLPSQGERSADQAVQLERLQDEVLERDRRLNEARAGIDQAQLSVEQKEAEVRQRFAVIDEPETPVAPLPRLRQAALTFIMALVLGSAIAFGAVVISTMLDRSLRFPGDVQDRLDMNLLAVVPHLRKRSMAPRKKGTADAPADDAPVDAAPAPTGADTADAANGARPSDTGAVPDASSTASDAGAPATADSPVEG